MYPVNGMILSFALLAFALVGCGKHDDAPECIVPQEAPIPVPVIDPIPTPQPVHLPPDITPVLPPHRADIVPLPDDDSKIPDHVVIPPKIQEGK